MNLVLFFLGNALVDQGYQAKRTQIPVSVRADQETLGIFTLGNVRIIYSRDFT